jgi:hypothetical protein
MFGSFHPRRVVRRISFWAQKFTDFIISGTQMDTHTIHSTHRHTQTMYDNRRRKDEHWLVECFFWKIITDMRSPCDEFCTYNNPTLRGRRLWLWRRRRPFYVPLRKRD